MVKATLDRISSKPSTFSRWLVIVAAGAILAGIAGWATGTLVGGVVAMWSFCLAAIVAGTVLPYPHAFVAPLFFGVLGWLVDMLPLVILVGWLSVIARWGVTLLRERRLPRAGRFTWLPAALVVWTGLGVLVITSLDFKHFLLLLGIQVLASGLLLAAVDQLGVLEERERAAAGLVSFVVVLSVAVFLQWIGVNIQALQHGETRKRVEAAYGVDAFPNNIGMIKYARSVKTGALQLRRKVDKLAAETPGLPPYVVFRPQFQAYENHLVVRFEGSAREFERDLAGIDVTLLYDNVGLAPANTVPRMRSFPRNALTYAGVSAATLPLAFFLAWAGSTQRRRLIGGAGIVSCLFGAGFSLARGAWIAIAIGIVYLFVDGAIPTRRTWQMAGAFVAAAVVLTATFFLKYDVDPVTGRAGGGASVSTRGDLYGDTLAIFKGPKRYVLLGYGTEKPRTESGTNKEGTRYVPRAGTHSTYLNYLFRTGVPGALIIVAVYVAAILHARAGARHAQGRDRILHGVLAAAAVIAAAHAVILSLYVEPIYTLTISLVLGLAVAGTLNLPGSVLAWRTARPEGTHR